MIQPGTAIKAHMEAVHRDPELWGPEDPELYVPERYAFQANIERFVSNLCLGQKSVTAGVRELIDPYVQVTKQKDCIILL